MSFDSAWKTAVRNRRGYEEDHQLQVNVGRLIRNSSPATALMDNINMRNGAASSPSSSSSKREHRLRDRTERSSHGQRSHKAMKEEEEEDVHPVVQGIGEFNLDAPLPSLEQVGPQTTLRFEYEGKDETFTLCWVDFQGRHHHAYQHSGVTWTHQELTNAGHAFSIFRKSDGALLCSYRVIAALNAGQMHVVKLPRFEAHVENVIVEARVIAEIPFAPDFPSNREWTVTYAFSVPPLPVSAKPDFFQTNTIYVWGDLSFDEYPYYEHEEEWRKLSPIHNYKMNQIVPQVMCGECLCGSDPETFVPKWKTFPSWVAQAQHYYQTNEGEEHGSRAVCGSYFHVTPGEKMRSIIHFNGSEMIIRIASEDHPENFSEIVSDNPFPNDVSIFPGGWAELFRMKEKPSTKTFKAFPCFNIEYKAQSADLDILEELCPFLIHDVKFPGFEPESFEQLKELWNVRGMNFALKKKKVMVEFC